MPVPSRPESRPRRRSRRAAATLAVLCALAAGADEARAQEDCEFVYPSGDLNMITLSGGARITYVGSPHMLCRDGVEIWADSAVAYSAQGMQHLIGNVRFIDASGELRAQEARYFPDQGRLQAEGDLFVRDTVQGFTIEHGRMVYLRANEFRDQPQIDVRVGVDGQRPRAVLTMKPAPAAAPPEPDSAGAPGAVPDSRGVPPSAVDTTEAAEPVEARPPTPYVVDADRIFLQGDTYFRAVGTVEIQRDSLLAFGDSAEYDQVAGRIHLVGSDARVETSGYDLSGRVIQMHMEGAALREVEASRDALLVGEDLELRAPRIRIFLDADRIQRLVAVRATEPDAPPEGEPAAGAPPGDRAAPERPLALADGFELTADSLDILAPAEVLERIHAVGAARSVSHARDSLNVEILPEVARADWLEGDTIVVTFLPPDSAAAPGDDPQARIDRVVARGGARSLYRLIPADSVVVPGKDPPAVHYVMGDAITLVMRDGEVARMEVTGQTRGLHLEPLRPRADSLADTTPVDSGRVAVDTSRVEPAVGGRRAPAAATAPPPEAPARGGARRTNPHTRRTRRRNRR